MPRKMVDGVYQKLKKFCGCGKLLTGLQSRYCSKICYTNQRKDNERIHYREHNPLIPDRICITCGENYTPRISRQQCCSRICRSEHTKIKSRESRSKNKAAKKASISVKWWQSPALDVEIIEKETVVTTVTDLKNSAHQSEIAAYLKGGGKVRKLVSQVNGRTPDITIPFNILTDENYNIRLDNLKDTLPLLRGGGFDSTLGFMDETDSI